MTLKTPPTNGHIRLFGTVCGYGSDPFTGGRLVGILWPGISRPRYHDAEDVVAID